MICVYTRHNVSKHPITTSDTHTYIPTYMHTQALHACITILLPYCHWLVTGNNNRVWQHRGSIPLATRTGERRPHSAFRVDSVNVTTVDRPRNAYYVYGAQVDLVFRPGNAYYVVHSWPSSLQYDAVLCVACVQCVILKFLLEFYFAKSQKSWLHEISQLYFREYVACLVLRPFSRMQTTKVCQ